MSKTMPTICPCCKSEGAVPATEVAKHDLIVTKGKAQVLCGPCWMQFAHPDAKVEWL